MSKTRAVALAETIARDQAATGLPPGSVFASAADLRARYNVSETTLRQAVLILEEQGVSFSRRGVGGGLIVGTPDSSALARAVAIYLEFAGATAIQCDNITRIINLLIAQSARQRLRLDTADNLRAEAARLENSKFANVAERHAKLRVLISASLGDPVLAFAAHAAYQFQIDIHAEARTQAEFEWRMELYWENTRDKLEAFISGDLERSLYLQEVNRDIHTREFQPTETSSDVSRVPARDSVAPQARKYEWILRNILSEIRSKGWPIGARLGSEPELMNRFGVSRSILRQAMRLLELHSAAKMQRGPNGGLVVVAPNRGHVIELVIGHLRDSGAQAANARSFRQELILSQMDELAVRSTSSQLRAIRRMLRQSIRTNANIWKVGATIQSALLKLADNPFVELFTECLAEFESVQSSLADPGVARDVPETLLDAILVSLAANDVHRARRAHLDYMRIEDRYRH